MVPAGFAFSGVSAHAWSHHRGCRVSLGAQLSGERINPHLICLYTATGRQLGDE